MGIEAIFFCGCVLGLSFVVLVVWVIVVVIRIIVMGGICMCFFISKFLEVYMVFFMAVRVSYCLVKLRVGICFLWFILYSISCVVRIFFVGKYGNCKESVVVYCFTVALYF